MLAAHTPALEMASQIAMAMSHMSALSVSKGKHHVVDQNGRLSTPFAALFSLMTPESVTTALKSATPAEAVKGLVAALDVAEVAGLILTRRPGRTNRHGRWHGLV